MARPLRDNVLYHQCYHLYSCRTLADSSRINNLQAKKSVVYIRTPAMAADQDFTVVLSAGAHADHLRIEASDTVKHHQVQPQKFLLIVRQSVVPLY